MATQRLDGWTTRRGGCTRRGVLRGLAGGALGGLLSRLPGPVAADGDQDAGAVVGFLGQWGGKGRGDGRFNLPFGVAVGGSGQVYIAEQNNNRIREFDATRNFVRMWGSYGDGDGQFDLLTTVTVDGVGKVASEMPPPGSRSSSPSKPAAPRPSDALLS